MSMNHYALLAISMTVALLSGIGSKYFINTYMKTSYHMHFFNTVSAVVAVIVLLIWNGEFHISWFTLCLGVLFGVTTAVQRIFSAKAMQIGPWSYTSVLASLSTIIPTMSGAVIWGEKLSAVQGAGIVLMLCCILMSSNIQKDDSKKSLRWMIYCAILFFSTGLIGVLQKFHQNTQYKEELGEFLIVALIFAAAASCILTVQSRYQVPQSRERSSLSHLIPLGLMLFTGAGTAINNRLNLFLSGILDSSVMFPIVNGGGLMLTTLAATIIFRERLGKKQWIGLGIGVISVILLCNPF